MHGRSLSLVDDEQQSESDAKQLDYEWEKVHTIDPNVRAPEFVFNSGNSSVWLTAV